jgi:hypothetical protein
VRALAVVALVLVVLMTGLPLGMMAGSCPACHLSDGPMSAGWCLAVLSLVVLLLPGMSRPLRRTRERMPLLLTVTGVERPPRA